MNRSIFFYSLVATISLFGMEEGTIIKNKSSRRVTILYPERKLFQENSNCCGVSLARHYIAPETTFILPPISGKESFFTVKVVGFSDSTVHLISRTNPVVIRDKTIKHNNRKVSSVKISQSKIDLKTLSVDEGEFI